MPITYAVGQRLTADLMQELADYTVNKPIVRLVQMATQSLSDNTNTSITFGTGSTIIDTHDMHSESSNNTRVTPTVAGVYEARGALYMNTRSDYASLQAAISLNGAPQPSNSRHGPNDTSSSRSIHVAPILLECNGSTDYIELIGAQDNTANASVSTVIVGSGSSYLEVVFVRPL